MKRNELMLNCPEEFENDLNEILDYFESKFNEINNLIKITSANELSQLEDAVKIAEDMSNGLLKSFGNLDWNLR